MILFISDKKRYLYIYRMSVSLGKLNMCLPIYLFLYQLSLLEFRHARRSIDDDQCCRKAPARGANTAPYAWSSKAR